MVELWMHTPKAVRANSALIIAPETRVFLVVGREGKRLIAWKCSLEHDGLRHPAFDVIGTNRYRPLPLTEEGVAKGYIPGEAANGSEPTAVFKPDSFYRRVTLAELRALQLTVCRNKGEATPG